MENYLTRKWIEQKTNEKIQIKNAMDAAEKYVKDEQNIESNDKENSIGTDSMAAVRAAKGEFMENCRLTPQQEKFIEEYLSNGKDAAMAYQSAYQDNMGRVRAGKLADKLLARPNVQRELDHRSNETAKREQIERAEIISDLKLLKRLSHQTGDTKTELRCIENLARIAGLFPSTGTLIQQNNITAKDRTIEVSYGTFEDNSKPKELSNGDDSLSENDPLDEEDID